MSGQDQTDADRSTEMDEEIDAPPRRILSPAAERALAEAEERRRNAAADPLRARELGGAAGPEPTRYGDWEKGGIASDF